jgi:hypothetical protein
VQQLSDLRLLLLAFRLHRLEARCAVLHDSKQAPLCGLQGVDFRVGCLLQLVRQFEQRLLLRAQR